MTPSKKNSKKQKFIGGGHNSEEYGNYKYIKIYILKFNLIY